MIDCCYTMSYSTGQLSYYAVINDFIPDKQADVGKDLLQYVNKVRRTRHSMLTNEMYREYVLPDKIGMERKQHWRDSVIHTFKDIQLPVSPSKYPLILKVVHEYVRKRILFTARSSPGHLLTYEDMLQSGKGDCTVLATMGDIILRGEGVPATIDFTYSWANCDGQMHSWVSIIEKGGRFTPFLPGDGSPSGYNPFIVIKYNIDGRHSTYKVCAKVFRRRAFPRPLYLHEPLFAQATTPMLQDGRFEDVTHLYGPVSDISIPNNHKANYIGVYNNNTWNPIWASQYLEGFDNKVFTNMRRGVMYCLMRKDSLSYHPVGSPFVLTKDGDIRSFNGSKVNNREIIISSLCSFVNHQLEQFSIYSGKRFHSRMHDIAVGAAVKKPIPGHKYRISYWQGEWKDAGEAIARAQLIFNNIPSGFIYRLLDIETMAYSRPFVVTPNFQFW